MKALFASIALLLFAGCTSSQPVNPVVVVGCSVEKNITMALAASVAQSMNCKNSDVIQNDILTALGKANICPQVTAIKGPIGNMICPLAVQSVMGLISTKIPTTWGCQSGSSDISSVLTSACSNAVGI